VFTLTITLSEPEWERIQEAAERLGTTPDALARQLLIELSKLTELEFDEALAKVISKWSTLYKRLA
jgi:hypothetical protein